MGHSLVLRFADVTGAVEVDGLVPRSAELDVALDSLRVVSSASGPTPLTPLDKQIIVHNALVALGANDHAHATFRSTSLQLSGLDLLAEGQLQISGTVLDIRLPLQLTFERERVEVRGTVEVTQSDFGVQPYSTMMGALRVGDSVTVDIALRAALPQNGGEAAS
jgi:polyisoprenoid-binding protein YceI